MKPSDQDALISAKIFKEYQKKRRNHSTLTGVIAVMALMSILGTIVSIFALPAAILLFSIFLILVKKAPGNECKPHDQIMRLFAESRNWYYEVETELRDVQWQERRVRFYCAARLLSNDDIADRLVANDFAVRAPQPSGEVPRNRSTFRQQSFTRVSTIFESFSKIPISTCDANGVSPDDSNPIPVPRIIAPSPLPVFSKEIDPKTDTFNDHLPKDKSTTISPSVQVINAEPELPNVLPKLEEFFEGATRQVTSSVYERDPRARQACLDHHGLKCRVCGFDFAESYGELGEGFIHVHHLRPLSEIAGEYQVNPITDLVPVCPNCHAMLHRRNPPLSPDELRKELARNVMWHRLPYPPLNFMNEELRELIDKRSEACRLVDVDTQADLDILIGENFVRSLARLSDEVAILREELKSVNTQD